MWIFMWTIILFKILLNLIILCTNSVGMGIKELRVIITRFSIELLSFYMFFLLESFIKLRKGVFFEIFMTVTPTYFLTLSSLYCLFFLIFMQNSLPFRQRIRALSSTFYLWLLLFTLGCSIWSSLKCKCFQISFILTFCYDIFFLWNLSFRFFMIDFKSADFIFSETAGTSIFRKAPILFITAHIPWLCIIFLLLLIVFHYFCLFVLGTFTLWQGILIHFLVFWK